MNIQKQRLLVKECAQLEMKAAIIALVWCTIALIGMSCTFQGIKIDPIKFGLTLAILGAYCGNTIGNIILTKREL